jgi:hypothetical protein
MASTRKRTDATPDWSVVFEDASSLRTVVDAISAVMQRATIRVARNRESGNFTLMVDAADLGMTCCVSARLRLEREHVTAPSGEEGEFTFCVDCKHMQTALDSPMTAHGTVTLSGMGDRVHVRITGGEVSHDEVSELRTFVDTEKNTEIRPLEFSTQLEIELSALRDVIKKARKWHDEKMRIRIHLKERGARQYSMVTLSISGDAHHEQRFYKPTSREPDGSLMCKAERSGIEPDETGAGEEDPAASEPHFEGTFLVDRIDSFIKILPTAKVMCRVMRGMPLMLTHAIGSDDSSHIRYLVAPLNDEE